MDRLLDAARLEIFLLLLFCIHFAFFRGGAPRARAAHVGARGVRGIVARGGYGRGNGALTDAAPATNRYLFTSIFLGIDFVTKGVEVGGHTRLMAIGLVGGTAEPGTTMLCHTRLLAIQGAGEAVVAGCFRSFYLLTK